MRLGYNARRWGLLASALQNSMDREGLGLNTKKTTNPWRGRIMLSAFVASVALVIAGASCPGYSPSPLTTKIAFSSERDGNFEIYVMNANGTIPTRLTNNATADAAPSWSPDGTKIAFRSRRDGNSEIYVMNANGTNQTRLTNNATADLEPSWRP